MEIRLAYILFHVILIRHGSHSDTKKFYDISSGLNNEKPFVSPFPRCRCLVCQQSVTILKAVINACNVLIKCFYPTTLKMRLVSFASGVNAERFLQTMIH